MHASGVELEVKFHSSCDIDPLCHRVLVAHSHPAEHCFTDLLRRMPDDVVEELRAIQALHRQALESAVGKTKELRARAW